MPSRLWHLMLLILVVALLTALARSIPSIEMAVAYAFWILSGLMLGLLLRLRGRFPETSTWFGWLKVCSLATFASLSCFSFTFLTLVLVLQIASFIFS